jgi:hypothetical protein
MPTDAEIGELVTFIALSDPEKLSGLQTKYPTRKQMLQPGAVLGADKREGDLPCDVALSALSLFGGQATKLRLRLRSRLAWSWRFDLLAKFLAACGSGGTVGILATGVGIERGVIAALIALGGSLCALFFSYMQRDETSGSIVASYNKLIVALVQAEELTRSLTLLCPSGSSPKLNEALGRANDTAKALNEIMLRYG